MILLDSNHTEQHVLAELEKYSKFVKAGSYIIVFDTMMEDMKKTITWTRFMILIPVVSQDLVLPLIKKI